MGDISSPPPVYHTYMRILLKGIILIVLDKRIGLFILDYKYIKGVGVYEIIYKLNIQRVYRFKCTCKTNLKGKKE